MTAPTKGVLPIAMFTMWLATGERGLSSETIVAHVTGVPVVRWPSEPLDPADFWRCERLIRAVPLVRLALSSMRPVSPVWARLVDAWDELVELGESEAPGMFDTAEPFGRAPLMYARMRDLRGVSA